MLNLDRISLVTIATKNQAECQTSIHNCLQHAKFSSVVVFTNDPTQYSGHLCFRVNPRSHQEWCVWRLTDFTRMRDKFSGQFILFLESDARLVNPSAWTDEFYKYDYIGAPWYDRVVGNGGFTLMSQKMLVSLDKLRLQPTIKACYPCDWKICRNHRAWLEANTCKFAPYELANRFSNETGEYLGAFGVHSAAMIAKVSKRIITHA